MKMAKRSAFYALSACLVAACSSNPFQPSDINNSVFNTPELFIDQEVRLCGFVLDRFENGNILTSKPTTPDPPLAIGFIAARDRHEPSRYDGKNGLCTRDNYQNRLRKGDYMLLVKA